ncbi:MAG: fatty acid hydroxylase family protein, partial [Acetobacter papayae]
TVFNLGYDLKQAALYPWVMHLTGAPPRDRPDGARPESKRA